MRHLEIQFWHVAKWLITRGYGRCEVLDYEELDSHPHALNAEGRCGSCRATEVVKWIDGHIELLRY